MRRLMQSGSKWHPLKATETDEHAPTPLQSVVELDNLQLMDNKTTKIQLFVFASTT